MITKREKCEKQIKCNYIKCAAGMGVAGNLNCFLDGDYTRKKCKKFIEENEFLNIKNIYCIPIGIQKEIICKICFDLCKKIITMIPKGYAMGFVNYLGCDFISCFSDDCPYLENQIKTNGSTNINGQSYEFYIRKLKEV